MPRNPAHPAKIRRALVTGGAGFLGSHLSERLIAEGAHVVCLDNFFTGCRENIAHLIHHPRFELIDHDVTKPFRIEADEIYNFACPASPVHYQRDPVMTTETNVLGAINVLNLARDLGVPVLQASTSEVYGDPLEHPQRETYHGNVNVTGPRACYDEGKRCAETLFFDYRRQFGLPIKVARIFNTYGPRMVPDDGRVVSSFIVQALAGGAITVFGSGVQTRSFCFVTDLIDGLIRLMRTGRDVTGPVNLGNPQEITVIDLARRIIGLCGSTSRIEHLSLPQDDPVRRCPDIALAGRILGWQPTTNLETGLAATIEYYEAVLPASTARRGAPVSRVAAVAPALSRDGQAAE